MSKTASTRTDFINKYLKTEEGQDGVVLTSELQSKVVETANSIMEGIDRRLTERKDEVLNEKNMHALIDLAKGIVITDMPNTELIEYFRKNDNGFDYGKPGNDITDSEIDGANKHKFGYYDFLRDKYQEIENNLRGNPAANIAILNVLDDATKDHGSESSVKCSWNLNDKYYTKLQAERAANAKNIDLREWQLLAHINPEKFEEIYDEEAATRTSKFARKMHVDTTLRNPRVITESIPSSELKEQIASNGGRMKFKKVRVREYEKGTSPDTEPPKADRKFPLELDLIERIQKDGLKVLNAFSQSLQNSNIIIDKETEEKLNDISGYIVTLSYSARDMVKYDKGFDPRNKKGKIFKKISDVSLKEMEEYQASLIGEIKGSLAGLSPDKAIAIRNALETIKIDGALIKSDVREELGLHPIDAEVLASNFMPAKIEHDKVPQKSHLKLELRDRIKWDSYKVIVNLNELMEKNGVIIDDARKTQLYKLTALIVTARQPSVDFIETQRKENPRTAFGREGESITDEHLEKIEVAKKGQIKSAIDILSRFSPIEAGIIKHSLETIVKDHPLEIEIRDEMGLLPSRTPAHSVAPKDPETGLYIPSPPLTRKPRSSAAEMRNALEHHQSNLGLHESPDSSVHATDTPAAGGAGRASSQIGNGRS